MQLLQVQLNCLAQVLRNYPHEGYALATTATEADDLNYNSATIAWSAPNIILPVATKYLYACTTTTINHATNFDAGRWNLAVYYTVL